MLLLNASNVRLMTKDSTRSSDRNRLLRLSGLVLLLLGVSLLLYGWNLSHQIEKRFSGRRWNIPSKIFSDVTILYPGQSINRPLFHETLYRLGYWEVPNEPERKGEMCISRSLVELFLHDLEIPSRKREGFPVRIRFVDDRIERIEHLKTGEPIPILEVEPEEVALFFGPERERRQLISIEQVPQHVIHAILAAEDRNFYEHRGLDPWGILRALYTNVRHGSIRQGGSTITQQLAKNYFLTSERKLSRKLKELFISITMEFMYEKNEILEIYLNEIYLGQKGTSAINGLGEASYFYFGKPVSELSLTEAATIAALIKGPNYYSPYVDKKRSLSRRNLVLNALHKAGWISDEELQVAIDAPANTIGFRDYGKKAPYFIDYLSEQLTTLYPPESLASLGLSIYTTLDTQVQIAAESALRRGLERIEKTNPTLIRSDPRKKLQGAIVVLQPKTGYVLAMVGGRNYSVSQFNRASQARRQPGSAFKPFVYLSGLDQFTPTSMLSNKPRSYEMDGKAWEPHNYESVAKDRVSLREAITHSINLATVDLAMNIGLDHIVRVVASFHFSTPLEPYPSLSLGASEVIPLELARAYCAFAADGVLPYPFSLKAVVDENGKILERKHVAIERVISPAEAFIMSSMLRSVVRKGTARSLSKMGIFFPVAGKTGTTNDFKDGWFVGYTPDILALVWVGFDSGESIHATGSATALPIWADLMKAIPHWVSAEWFTMPPGVVKQTVCLHSGQLAVKDGCPDQTEELFLAIHVPTNYCPLHRRVGPLERVMKEVKDFFEKF
jgi:penicillin-binding protein 1B